MPYAHDTAYNTPLLVETDRIRESIMEQPHIKEQGALRQQREAPCSFMSSVEDVLLMCNNKR